MVVFLVADRGLYGTWASVVVSEGPVVWFLGSRAQTGSVVVADGLSCSMACGIFLDQGSNLCLRTVRQILYH